jgi:uncharacterized protein HemX
MLEASEEKLQSKMEAIESSISTRLSRLDNMPTLWQIFGVAGATAGAVIATILAILAFAGDRFDGGIQFSTVAMQQTLEAKQLSEKNERQLAEQQKQMGELLPLLTRLLEKQGAEAEKKGP